jgi:hypothetical protein
MNRKRGRGTVVEAGQGALAGLGRVGLDPLVVGLRRGNLEDGHLVLPLTLVPRQLLFDDFLKAFFSLNKK